MVFLESLHTVLPVSAPALLYPNPTEPVSSQPLSSGRLGLLQVEVEIGSHQIRVPLFDKAHLQMLCTRLNAVVKLLDYERRKRPALLCRERKIIEPLAKSAPGN